MPVSQSTIQDDGGGTSLIVDSATAEDHWSSNHPSRRRSTGPLIALTASVWMATFLLSTVHDLGSPPANFLLVTELRFAFAVLGGFMCWPLYKLLETVAAWRFAYRTFLALPAATVIAVFYCSLTFAAQRQIDPSPVSYGESWAFYNNVYWLLVFLVWTALYLALSYNREAAEQASLFHRMQTLAHDAQLRALRYQVDPHFLFNALNSASALVVTGRYVEAEATLGHLSRFFRASSALDPEADIPLGDEVQLQRTYLEIEQIRFPDLTFSVCIPEALLSAKVPALLLQPIVENAIKFAVATREAASNISILAQRERDDLVVTVEDDGDGRSLAHLTGTGTGLRNIAERLIVRFGARGSLMASGRPGGGFSVRLAFPLQYD